MELSIADTELSLFSCSPNIKENDMVSHVVNVLTSMTRAHIFLALPAKVPVHLAVSQGVHVLSPYLWHCHETRTDNIRGHHFS